MQLVALSQQCGMEYVHINLPIIGKVELFLELVETTPSTEMEFFLKAQ